MVRFGHCWQFLLGSEVSLARIMAAVTKPLYNGNINHMITSIRDFMRGKDNNNQPEAPHVKVYEYDQLNRLAYAHTYEDAGLTVNSSNTWSTLSQANKYSTNYTYDANGNIINLDRFDKTGQQIDEFNYNYPANRNRLTPLFDFPPMKAALLKTFAN